MSCGTLEEPVEERLLSDPYAGVFFSKDRTERVIEPAEEPEYTDVPVPPVANRGDERETYVRVRVLSSGDWMKGCPEGSQWLLYLLREAPLNLFVQMNRACSSSCTIRLASP